MCRQHEEEIAGEVLSEGYFISFDLSPVRSPQEIELDYIRQRMGGYAYNKAQKHGFAICWQVNEASGYLSFTYTHRDLLGSCAVCQRRWTETFSEYELYAGPSTAELESKFLQRMAQDCPHVRAYIERMYVVRIEKPKTSDCITAWLDNM